MVSFYFQKEEGDVICYERMTQAFDFSVALTKITKLPTYFSEHNKYILYILYLNRFTHLSL